MTNKEDRLTQDLLRELFRYKNGKLYWRVGRKGVRRGGLAGWVEPDGYRAIGIDQRAYKAHRLIWLYHYGEWPENHIDHVNQDRLDNRIENLRDVTNAENQKNRRINSDNTSGFTGVLWYKSSSKWAGRVKHEGKQIHLGMFADKEDAALAVYAARMQLGFHENHGGNNA